MATKKVTVEGIEFDVREMTFREIRTIREKGGDLPYTWPAEQQFGPERLDDLPMSAVGELSREIYDLTYGTAKQLGN